MSYCGAVGGASADLVREALAMFRSGSDFDPSVWAGDVEFDTRGDLGVVNYRGIDGLRQARAMFEEVWESIEFEPLELVERPNGVAVALRFSLRSRAGVDLEVDEGWAYWVRDGRIARVKQCPTHAEALAALDEAPG